MPEIGTSGLMSARARRVSKMSDEVPASDMIDPADADLDGTTPIRAKPGHDVEIDRKQSD
jgi:hypothetical protein